MQIAHTGKEHADRDQREPEDVDVMGLELELLHAPGGEREFRVRGHVGKRRQIGFGAAVGLGIATAVQVGLRQGVRL